MLQLSGMESHLNVFRESLWPRGVAKGGEEKQRESKTVEG
jgi:hypothetical protein